MMFFEKSKYTPKRTKLHHFKFFSRGSMPQPEPPSGKVHGFAICPACRFARCKFPNLEKNPWPPSRILATPLAATHVVIV